MYLFILQSNHVLDRNAFFLCTVTCVYTTNWIVLFRGFVFRIFEEILQVLSYICGSCIANLILVRNVIFYHTREREREKTNNIHEFTTVYSSIQRFLARFI